MRLLSFLFVFVVCTFAQPSLETVEEWQARKIGLFLPETGLKTPPMTAITPKKPFVKGARLSALPSNIVVTPEK